jgi:hypothetical protein
MISLLAAATIALNMEQNPATSKWIRVSDRLPPLGQFVRYRTKDFTSAGRCYEDGSWLDSTGKPEVAEVLEWLEQ